MNCENCDTKDLSKLNENETFLWKEISQFT